MIGIVLGLLVAEFYDVLCREMAENVAEMMRGDSPLVKTRSCVFPYRIDWDSDLASIVFEMVGKIFVFR